mmetsp:Transcript_94853/g.225859  ORF Transcript_94853/g.225859 Transcript_94853/m.225859 type:complete len:260 (-) Transcript_94853:1278-2057(-)
MDPFRSSKALWILLLKLSASRRAADGTSTALAAKRALKSSSLASSKASMLFRSTSFSFSTTFATSFLHMARCCSCAKMSKACANSASGSSTERALSMADSSTVSSSSEGPLSPAACTLASCAASASRASCLGASTANTASEVARSSGSTPASLACWRAKVRAATSRASVAFLSAAAAASLDSAPESSSSKGWSSSAGRRASFAKAMASRKALLPLAWASLSCCRACARGISSAKTCSPCCSSFSATPFALAFSSASCKA